MSEQYVEIHAYARNSDTKQEHSQETQLSTLDKACNRLIPELFGGRVGKIVDVYKDEGKSASKKRTRRPDFERLMGDIEAGKVRILLVVNLSRFSRLSHIDAMRLHTKLYEHNVTLVSIDDRKIISIEDLVGFIEVALKSSNDHEYARTVAKNTLRGSIRSVERGQPHVNAAPYGMCKLFIDETGREHRYARTDAITKPKGWKGYLIPGDPKEVGIVRWVFTTYANRDVSRSWLASELNKHSDLEVRRGPRGNGWSEESVRHMLHNHHYVGRTYIGARPNGDHYRTGDGDIIEARKHTAPSPVFGQSPYAGIVDNDLFQRVQAKLQRNAERNAKPQTANTEGYPLTGCLICGNCGFPLFAMPNKGNPRYQCRSATRHTSHGCGHWSVREDEMLPFLLNAIDRAMLKQLQDAPTVPEDVEQQAIQRQITEIDGKIAAIKARMAVASVDAVVALADTVAVLTDQKAALTVQRRQSDHQERIRLAYDRWEALVEPYLIQIKTDDLGHDNAAVAKLGLQDEVDRLFNTTKARPSAVRGLLHRLDTKVECWFRQEGGSGLRKRYVLDRGRLNAQIDGRRLTTVSSPGC